MEIYISNASQSPIYAQITGQIKEKILSGELKTGEALPSIRLLAKELRISVITTKRAYEDLEADSLEAVELSMALEEAFGVGIADEDMTQVKTVADIVNYLSGKKQ